MCKVSLFTEMGTYNYNSMTLCKFVIAHNSLLRRDFFSRNEQQDMPAQSDLLVIKFWLNWWFFFMPLMWHRFCSLKAKCISSHAFLEFRFLVRLTWGGGKASVAILPWDPCAMLIYSFWNCPVFLAPWEHLCQRAFECTVCAERSECVCVYDWVAASSRSRCGKLHCGHFC